MAKYWRCGPSQCLAGRCRRVDVSCEAMVWAADLARAKCLSSVITRLHARILLITEAWQPVRPVILFQFSNGRFVAWHSGRTSVSGRRTFPVPRSTCSWWVSDHYCGWTIRYRSANEANSAFHPFGVDKWVVSWNRMPVYTAGTIWWKLRRYPQAWQKVMAACRRVDG